MAGRENYEYVLELKNVSKTFPGVKALDHVNLKLRPGRVHALCGENGAGKSTLIKIANGMHKRDAGEGEIWYKGEKIEPQNAKQMIEMGIATIHQELSPVLDMTIAENIFLGREPRNSMKLVDFKTMYAETQKLLDEFGLKYDPESTLRNLTVSDIALIEIVKALSKDASVVIMDEPTSSITDSEVHILFENIERLKKKGVAILYVSHKMDEIMQICDDLTVFRDGQWVHSGEIKDITKDGIIKIMVGREIKDQFPKTPSHIGDTVLEVRNLTGEKFQNVSFKIHAGEIVGFAGLVGAGRSEVFRAIFGLDPIKSGEIYLNGEKVSFRNTQQAIDAGILMASEDRKREGCVLGLSIRENMSLASLKNIEKGGFLDLKQEKKNVVEMVQKLHIKIASAENPVSSLSGGNQQKVVLAKWLLLSPKVLILDEPTRGIDVGAKYEIYKLMCQLAAEGVAIVMISSEMPEILGMSDTVAVMSQGKLTGELPVAKATQEKIMELAVKGFER